MKNNKFHSYILLVAKILIFAFPILVFFDTFLSLAGYRTILLHLHDIVINVAIALGLLAFILAGFEIVDVISKRKWKRLVTATTIIIAVGLIYFFSCGYLAKIAKISADSEILDFFNSPDKYRIVKVEEKAQYNYEYFLANFDESRIQPLKRSPFSGSFRYFIDSANNSFYVNLTLSHEGNKYWVYVLMPNSAPQM